MALHAAYKWFPDQKRAIPAAIISLACRVRCRRRHSSVEFHYHDLAIGTTPLALRPHWIRAGRCLGGPRKEGPDRSIPALADRRQSRPLFTVICSSTPPAWLHGARISAPISVSHLCCPGSLRLLVKGLGFDQILAGKLTALPFLVSFLVLPLGKASAVAAYDAERGEQSGSSRYCSAAVAICLGAGLLSSQHLMRRSDGDDSFDRCRDDPSRVPVFILSPAILRKSPASQRGAILGINSAIGTSAGIIAPYVMGSVIEASASTAQGYINGFVICGIVNLIGGLIARLFLRPARELAGFGAKRNRHLGKRAERCAFVITSCRLHESWRTPSITPAPGTTSVADAILTNAPAFGGWYHLQGKAGAVSCKTGVPALRV